MQKLCSNFDADYWLARDRDGKFPDEFVQEIVAGEWLGIAMPIEYGGAGLGIIDMAKRTGNELLYNIEKINDDYSFFILTITISQSSDENR